MMKKISKIFFILLFIFTGCKSTTSQEVIEESKEPFVMQIFYSQTCPRCKSLKENLVPALQKEFGDQISFLEHDIDFQESIDLYYEYTGIYDWQLQEWTKETQLLGMPTDALCNDDKSKCAITWIPFVVVGDMYAYFGYDNAYLDEYIEDMHLALQNQSLTDGELKVGRYYIIDEKMD